MAVVPPWKSEARARARAIRVAVQCGERGGVSRDARKHPPLALQDRLGGTPLRSLWALRLFRAPYRPDVNQHEYDGEAPALVFAER